MADIRINSLPSTASASSSDDFLALDGATNGTRKLNAYSPTFGGNLTVSGTASVTGQINGSAGYQFRGATGTTYELLRYVGGTNNPGIFATVNESTKKVTIFASGSLVSGQTLGLGAEGSEALTLGAANATLSGNLTVSGTGTSSVAGSFGVGTTTPNKLLEAAKNLATNTVGAGEVLRLISDDGNTVGRVTEIGFGVGPTGGATYAPITLGAVVTLASGYNKKDFYIATRDSTTDSAPSEKLRLFANGNLGLGTGSTDSGNGKLQLATHTTSAGGIGFGTSTSLFTDTARLVLVGGTTTRFRLLSTGGNAADFQFDNSELAIGNSSSIRFYTTGTALTLDSSLNATFAGKVATGGAAAIGVAVSTGLGLNVNLNPGTLTYGAADAWLGARIRPARSGTTGNAFAISGQLEVSSGTQTKAATIMAEAPSGTITNHTYFYANSSGSRVAPTGNYSLYAESTAGPAYIGDATASTSTTTGALQVAGGVGVAGAVNVGGAIAIGNTVQTAAGVSSTHKVTISIGGTTYYLLATNV